MYDSCVQIHWKPCEREPELGWIAPLGHDVVDSRAAAVRITGSDEFTLSKDPSPKGDRSHKAPSRTRFRSKLGLGALRSCLRIADETGRQFGDGVFHVFNSDNEMFACADARWAVDRRDRKGSRDLPRVSIGLRVRRTVDPIGFEAEVAHPELRGSGADRGFLDHPGHSGRPSTRDTHFVLQGARHRRSGRRHFELEERCISTRGDRFGEFARHGPLFWRPFVFRAAPMRAFAGGSAFRFFCEFDARRQPVREGDRPARGFIAYVRYE